MNVKLKDALKKFYLRTKYKFPQTLPLNSKELYSFLDSIFFAYNLPDMPSYRHAAATMIMHLPPDQARARPSFFARSIKKAMSNQVAYELIDAIRLEEKAKQQAEAAELSTQKKKQLEIVSEAGNEKTPQQSQSTSNPN